MSSLRRHAVQRRTILHAMRADARGRRSKQQRQRRRFDRARHRSTRHLSRKYPLPPPHSPNPYRPHRPRHRSPSRHPHSPARNSPRPSRPSRRFPNQSPHKKLLQLPPRRQKCQSPLRPEKFPPSHLLRLQHRLPALLLRPRRVLPSPAHLPPLPPAHPAPRFSPALRSSSSPARCSRSCSPRVRCRPPQSALPSA